MLEGLHQNNNGGNFYLDVTQFQLTFAFTGA